MKIKDLKKYFKEDEEVVYILVTDDTKEILKYDFDIDNPSQNLLDDCNEAIGKYLDTYDSRFYIIEELLHQRKGGVE